MPDISNNPGAVIHLSLFFYRLGVRYLSWLVFFLCAAQPISFASAKITLRLYIADDSTAVTQFAAVLYNAGGVKQDSLISSNSNKITFSNIPTGIEERNKSTPNLSGLQQNYPNPFNPSTRIRFALPKSGNIDFKIFDLLAREIASYSNHLNAGEHELEWSPNEAAGVYFYMIKGGDFSQVKKMVLVDGVHGSKPAEVEFKLQWQLSL